MNTAAKLLEAMRNNPLDWQINQLQTVIEINAKGAFGMRHHLDDYPFEIRPLSKAEGGGFLISYPDFSECISDGETVEEAIANGRDALMATIAVLEVKGLPVPAPNSGGVASGKFVARVPKSIHAQLAMRARAEGVSLNTLVLTLLAEGLGRRESPV